MSSLHREVAGSGGSARAHREVSHLMSSSSAERKVCAFFKITCCGKGVYVLHYICQVTWLVAGAKMPPTCADHLFHPTTGNSSTPCLGPRKQSQQTCTVTRDTPANKSCHPGSLKPKTGHSIRLPTRHNPGQGSLRARSHPGTRPCRPHPCFYLHAETQPSPVLFYPEAP